jgi:L-ribulose-5-phosphate 3-epimerase
VQEPSSIPVGIYEKTLPTDLSWEGRLDMAASVGFDFVEISIDESDEKIARLSWTAAERAELRTAISNTGVPVMTMGLSGHRKYPLGSSSRMTRDRAVEILYQAIDLAADIGIKIIQVMGYDVFYETSDEDTHRRYLEGLALGAKRAGTAGVMLGVENVDVKFSESVEKILQIVKAIGSPWVNIYPDMGNLAASGFDPASQLRYSKDYIVAVHVKDAVRNVYRGVTFGEGDVQFDAVFRTLAEIGFWGPMVVEMWAQFHTEDAVLKNAIQARELVDRLIASTWKQDMVSTQGG